MTSISKNTQTSQAKKTDFKEKSLSQLTFSGASNLFNRRYSRNLTSLKHNVLSGSFDTKKERYSRLRKETHQSTNYIYYFKKNVLERFFGSNFTNYEIDMVRKILSLPANLEYIGVGILKKRFNMTYRSAHRILKKLTQREILRSIPTRDFRMGKEDEYYLTEKFKQFNNAYSKTAEGKIKMSKSINEDERISFPAKLLFSAIDNNCNNYNVFFYDYEKLNKWLGSENYTSEDYHKRLLKELEEAGYIQKEKKNLYHLVKRTERKLPESSAEIFRTRVSSSINKINTRTHNNYIYNEKHGVITDKRDEIVFKFIPIGSCNYSKQKNDYRKTLKEFLRKLDFEDFVILLCQVYGMDKALPEDIRSRSIMFCKIKEIAKQALNQKYNSRENMILSAWFYRNITKKENKYQIYIIQWLKKGYFLVAMKKVISSSELFYLNNDIESWQKTHGTFKPASNEGLK